MAEKIPFEPGSGAWRVADHLRAQKPDTVLDRREVGQMLGVALGAVDTVLQPGIEAGVLCIAHHENLGRVWRLRAPANNGKPAARLMRARPDRLPPLDISQTKVLSDVPLPEAATGVRGTHRYDDLLGALTADGMCRIDIPAAYRNAISKALPDYMRRRPDIAQTSRFAIRLQPNDTIGIWRVARQPDARPTGRAAHKKG